MIAANAPSATTAIGVKTRHLLERVLRHPGADEPDREDDEDHRDPASPRSQHGTDGTLRANERDELRVGRGLRRRVPRLPVRLQRLDFEERITAAAVQLGLIAANDLDEEETADLVELAADGRIAEPRSGLGRYLVRHWEQRRAARGRVARLLAAQARLPRRLARPPREGGPARGRLGRGERRLRLRRAARRPRAARARARALVARAPVQALTCVARRDHRRSSPRCSRSTRRSGAGASSCSAARRGWRSALALPRRPPAALRRRRSSWSWSRPAPSSSARSSGASTPTGSRTCRASCRRRTGSSTSPARRSRAPHAAGCRSVGSSALALVLVVGWGLAGVTVLPRDDVGGAFGAALLAVYLVRGRAPHVYAGVFLVVAWLELYGTALGTWDWAPVIPGTGSRRATRRAASRAAMSGSTSSRWRSRRGCSRRGDTCSRATSCYSVSAGSEKPILCSGSADADRELANGAERDDQLLRLAVRPCGHERDEAVAGIRRERPRGGGASRRRAPPRPSPRRRARARMPRSGGGSARRGRRAGPQRLESTALPWAATLCGQGVRKRARVEDDERLRRPRERDVEVAQALLALRDQRRLDDDHVVELETLRLARRQERRRPRRRSPSASAGSASSSGTISATRPSSRASRAASRYASWRSSRPAPAG